MVGVVGVSAVHTDAHRDLAEVAHVLMHSRISIAVRTCRCLPLAITGYGTRKHHWFLTIMHTECAGQ